MARPKLKIVESRKRHKAERQRTFAIAKAEDQWVDIQKYIRKTGRYPELRICKQRSVIGEKYNHARLSEAIITFRFGDPVILDLTALEGTLRSYCATERSTGYIFGRIKYHAEYYMEERKKVKHRKWKESE